jgi:hypothetical protein
MLLQTTRKPGVLRDYQGLEAAKHDGQNTFASAIS